MWVARLSGLYIYQGGRLAILKKVPYKSGFRTEAIFI